MRFIAPKDTSILAIITLNSRTLKNPKNNKGINRLISHSKNKRVVSGIANAMGKIVTNQKIPPSYKKVHVRTARALLSWAQSIRDDRKKYFDRIEEETKRKIESLRRHGRKI